MLAGYNLFFPRLDFALLGGGHGCHDATDDLVELVRQRQLLSRPARIAGQATRDCDVVVLVRIALGGDGELCGHGDLRLSRWGRATRSADIDYDGVLSFLEVKAGVLAISIASAAAVEAEQTNIDTIGSVMVVEAERAFLLVHMLRWTRKRQRREGGTEMWTSHFGGC